MLMLLTALEGVCGVMLRLRKAGWVYLLVGRVAGWLAGWMVRVSCEDEA